MFDVIASAPLRQRARSASKSGVSAKSTRGTASSVDGKSARGKSDVGKSTGQRGARPAKRRRRARRLFLSYRRRDSTGICGRVYDWLVARFGARTVVKDVFSIRPGVDFEAFIEETIPACSVMLLLIGPEWAASKPDMPRPLFSPADPVRRELEIALASNVRIVPVLVGGARLPTAKQLPKKLRGLLKLHAVTLRDDPHFRDDFPRLVEHL